MIWERLKTLKCPNPTCNKYIYLDKNDNCYHCKCGFKIANEKFINLVNKMYQPKFTKEIDPDQNLSDLNNL